MRFMRFTAENHCAATDLLKRIPQKDAFHMCFMRFTGCRQASTRESPFHCAEPPYSPNQMSA
jgi:hypothetical protein